MFLKEKIILKIFNFNYFSNDWYCISLVVITHVVRAALFIPINFAFLILLIRKFEKLDLVPALFYGGVIIIVVGFFMSKTIIISPHDLLISFILGTFQHAFGFICIVIGARSTPSVTVGLLMLSKPYLDLSGFGCS